MPLIDVAFKKVDVDIVGFLHPPTDKGNIYLFLHLSITHLDTQKQSHCQELKENALLKPWWRFFPHSCPQRMFTDM